MDEIASRKALWQETAQLKKARQAKIETGLDIAPLYTPDDLATTDFFRDIGFPGEVPFTRGIYPLMYRDRLWGIRQYSGFGTAEDTNRRWKALAESGQVAGVSLANDLPTQLGYDSDDPIALDEVGRVGCAVDTLSDLNLLFDGIPLDKTPVSFNQSTQAPFFLAGLIAVAKRQGVDQARLLGTVSNCTLLEYACRGNWVYPAVPSMRMAIDVASYCIQHMPRYFPFNFFGCNLRSAGATMAEEVGFTFAIAMAYLDEALRRKIDIDDIAPRISFFFTSGIRMFEEAAKLRGGRRAWARLMADHYGAKKEASKMMRMTVYPFASEFSPVEPELNLVRAACGVAAAAMAGAQVIWSPSIDENFAIPSERTARWALRTGQILAEETDVAKTVDPLGGSWFVESLTNAYEEAIMAAVAQIERAGGAIQAIESGYMQRQMADNAYRWERDTASGKRVVVGFNKYRLEGLDEEPIAVHRTDAHTVEAQVRRLRQVRETRDSPRVRAALDNLRRMAEGEENLVPAFLEAVEAYATVGEITSALKSVWGTFKEPVDV